MSYEVTYIKNASKFKSEKNIVVNTKTLYKIRIEKECIDNNANYRLEIENFENGIDTKMNLPHEVMSVLNEMISNSLDY